MEHRFGEMVLLDLNEGHSLVDLGHGLGVFLVRGIEGEQDEGMGAGVAEGVGFLLVLLEDLEGCFRGLRGLERRGGGLGVSDGLLDVRHAEGPLLEIRDFFVWHGFYSHSFVLSFDAAEFFRAAARGPRSFVVLPKIRFRGGCPILAQVVIFRAGRDVPVHEMVLLEG